MIKSAAEYEYVVGADVDEAHPHGDLDRIQIDGEVMPKRTGDTGKTDADGNAIPRTKILRGEDVAFLMEAAGQRCGANWLTHVWVQYWVFYDGSYVRAFQETAYTAMRLWFDRRVCPDNFARIVDGFDHACARALNGLDLGAAKAASSMGSGLFEDYGYSGLPDNFRKYAALATPAHGDALGRDFIVALFATLAFMPCGYLGTVDGHLSMNPLNTSDSAPVDLTVAASEGFDWRGNVIGVVGYWGVNMRKGRYYADVEASTGLAWRSGTLRLVPTPETCLLNFEAPHLTEARAYLEIKVSWGDDGAETEERKVWWPVALAHEGKKFFLYGGTVGTAEALASILLLAGWTEPSIPSADAVWAHRATINVLNAHVLGRWDGHTNVG